MDQFEIRVSRVDVIRVVERMFSQDAIPEVLNLLDEYGQRPYHVMKDRVHLAILKESGSVFWDLKRNVHVALIDPRDVLSGAESPRLLALGPKGFVRLSQDSPEDLQRLQKVRF